MSQIYDMGPTALLPLRRKAAEDFFALKNPTASAGFEPAYIYIHRHTHTHTHTHIPTYTYIYIYIYIYMVVCCHEEVSATI